MAKDRLVLHLFYFPHTCPVQTDEIDVKHMDFHGLFKCGPGTFLLLTDPVTLGGK
jgi:hypothetical protein